MKRKILVLLCVLCILLTGCNKEKNSKEEYMNKEIEKVIVYYEKEGISCSVWIYMDKGERKIAVYSEPEQVTEDKYNYVDELKTFICERIIDSEKKFESGSSSGNQDDQKLLWRIRIVFSDGERVSLSSLYDYPEYWNELVQLIEK